MPKVAIIHFSPLEFYPPVQNLLKSLQPAGGTKIYVYTTKKNVSYLSTFAVSNPNIKIKRYGHSGNNLSPFIRWLGYFLFYVGTFLHLLATRPLKLLYYETLSFFPVFLYKKLIKRKVAIWAHYHEYTSPSEYEEGMMLSRRFHEKEQQVYANMEGVSHTNETRLKMFLRDIAPARPQQQVAIPNYPPSTWGNVSTERSSGPIRVVYIGALSLDTMYTREFADWIQDQQGRVVWDIYTFNASASVESYLQILKDDNISLKAGVDYDQLPNVLSKYDVGVILYTGHIVNYIHNAPNKLFEYLRMGLQVWLPDSLLGAKAYLRSTDHPRVLSLDFKNLTLKIDEIEIKNSTLQEPFVAEIALAPLLKFLNPSKPL